MTRLSSIILALSVVAALGCGTDARVDASANEENFQEVQAQFDVPSGNSLYALSGDWADQEGGGVQLVDLQGRPVLMAMVYTNCHYACPIIVHDMKRIDRELPIDLAEDVRFVLVSLDPERDDTHALSRFARAYGLDAERWILLQGDPGDVRMLAAALGVKYKKEADGLYSHTNLVAVLDEKGEIIHREINPGGESTSILAALLRGGEGASL